MRAAPVVLSLLAGLLPRPSPTPAAPPTTPAASGGPVILFLIDNSASLPPLDPNERRVVALEKMFTFLHGQRYRLVLFGGRRENAVDDLSRYRNDGQWTDFYYAFLQARTLAESYPRGTELRMVLVTDAIPDPDPADWPDLPPGWTARAESARRSVELVREMKIPLYVIIVGEAPAGVAGHDAEQSPGFVLDLVRAANGEAAAPLAQSLATFFAQDGVLLKKFVYRVRPGEGLAKIQPVITRISAPPRAGIELRIFTWFVLPLLLVLVVLLGLLVRSFPGPGDLELVELAVDQPLHLAVDRMHRLPSGVWSAQGLSLVGDLRQAVASLTLQAARVDTSGRGYECAALDARDAALLPLGLEALRRALETATDSGNREEKIHALNLDYAARSLQGEEVERILLRPPATGRGAAGDFLRAKVHLALDPALQQKLLEPRVQIVSYGRDAGRRELAVGARLRLGRYGFRVQQIARGGRREVCVSLYYDRVPSLLGLKTVLPDFFQRIARFRRSAQRYVS